MKIANLEKADKSRPRMVVITQGADPTLIFQGGEVTTHPILKIAPEDILDTNGAGDAFVGGFLAQLVQGKGVKECVKSGNWAANLIIQRSGCTFPDVCTYQA